jgi:mevalonate kinase
MPVEDITFAALLTAAGAGIAAAITTSVVELLKRVFDPPVSGALLAFAASAALYVLAGIATGADTLDEALVVFLAWLTCATAAVGIHSTIRTARQA